MHGLYLSRRCDDLQQLSRELLGLHSWFYRNVAFSAHIRGAALSGWQTALTKTWLYRGTLHGVVFDDLPLLLALHSHERSPWLPGGEQLDELADRVVALMEDGVYSRAEMRQIFAYDTDPQVIDQLFSPWGGIFVHLARRGKVAFRDMASRDFDLISAEPSRTFEQALPQLLRRFFTVYGPATLDDAAWFFGLWKAQKKQLKTLDLDEYDRLDYDGKTFYYVDNGEDINDIPALTLLSGFDPLIVSYTSRLDVVPAEYKSAVILKSGICQPTIAVNGQVVGLWNIKKDQPVLEFFNKQPKKIQDRAHELVNELRWTTAVLA